ncbi:tyrosine-type recombinase/integrase [Aeromonas caviae]|uniref:tyrosine-type recombinase/integrase n=1 Tax=Aeromonas caviae TaxID=648 RepID=UPI002B493E7C|nr:tyrosine-type recombinase/integrase [Aeromonas caviae]
MIAIPALYLIEQSIGIAERQLDTISNNIRNPPLGGYWLTDDTRNPYLFPGKRQGQPLQNPTKGFQRMLAQAGIDKEGVCLHTCRHSVSALIVSKGGTLFDVQSQLGHRSTQTSLRYAHLHNTRMQQTSQKIANCIHDALTSSGPSKPLPLPEEDKLVQAR